LVERAALHRVNWAAPSIWLSVAAVRLAAAMLSPNNQNAAFRKERGVSV